MTKKVESPKAELVEAKVIAKGKSIVSKKRILKPGDVVTSKHFEGGEDVLAFFEREGFIETKKVEK